MQETGTGQFLVNISCANFVLGDVVVEPKTRSGSVFSFKTLKSRFSEPEREQDHSPVKREVCVLDLTTPKKKPVYYEALLGI